MTEIIRISSAEPVIHGVLKVTWNDGYTAVVDLRPIITRGNVFTYLQDPQNFQKVRVGEHGHAVFWINERGDEIDFGTDALRQRAERQADIQLQAG
jgi:hypothetical protein